MARKAVQKSGKPALPKRRSRGFVQTSGLLKSSIRSATEKRGFSETRLLTQWVEIAGADVAARSNPVKVSYSKQGMGATLTLLCRGADAPMLQMQIPQIVQRVNGVYGYNAISRITLTQTAPMGFAEKPTPFDHKPKSKQLSAQQTELVETSVEDVADSSLKSALSELGKNILARSST